MRGWRAALALVAIPAFACTQRAGSDSGTVDWCVTGGGPGNTRYSALDQINRRNVGQFKVAWTYHTGDVPPDGHAEIQATPIVVKGVLYTTTPALAAIALRAASG